FAAVSTVSKDRRSKILSANPKSITESSGGGPSAIHRKAHSMVSSHAVRGLFAKDERAFDEMLAGWPPPPCLSPTASRETGARDALNRVSDFNESSTTLRGDALCDRVPCGCLFGQEP